MKVQFLVLSVLFFVFGAEATNLTCESRLRECEREVKTLLKRNSECTTDIDSLKLEISHLSDIVSQYEKGGKHGSRNLLTWATLREHLKHFTSLFRSLLIVAYNNVPSEVDLMLRKCLSRIGAYANPVVAKCTDFFPKAYELVATIITGYSNVIDRYAAYAHLYGGVINEKLDRFVARIESADPHLVGSIPESLCDRVFYILCAILVLYAATESVRIVVKTFFRCIGMKCCRSDSKKATKSPSSKSTPGSRKR